MDSDYDETPGTSPTRVGVGWGGRLRFPNLKHFHPPEKNKQKYFINHDNDKKSLGIEKTISFLMKGQLILKCLHFLQKNERKQVDK